MIRTLQTLRGNSRKADRGEARAAGVVATSLFAKFRVSRSALRSSFLPAFTLIEMLIVVALIATLMTIVLRLSSVSAGETQRNKTIVRLAKLENCLSGYYAAYGNYPPVRLHNTRDIYRKADGHGVQSTDELNESIWGWKTIGEEAEQTAWYQVEAACRAQPVGAEFPFKKNDDIASDIANLRDVLQKNLSTGKFTKYPKSGTAKFNAIMADFDGLQDNLGRFDAEQRANVSWRDIQLFKFGLMSFLLPRYQMMMGADDPLYENYAQWSSNNTLPRNPMNGTSYTSWDKLNQLNRDAEIRQLSRRDQAELENIPVDAICARWLPNLAASCAGTKASIVYFGVDIADGDSASANLFSPSDDPTSHFPPVHIYSPDGDSTSSQYILDSVTILDGWNNEFYYYSPSPHQSYQIWSAGANGRTFPPWVSRQELSGTANECVYKWTEDDIKGMKN